MRFVELVCATESKFCIGTTSHCQRWKKKKKKKKRKTKMSTTSIQGCAQGEIEHWTAYGRVTHTHTRHTVHLYFYLHVIYYIYYRQIGYISIFWCEQQIWRKTKACLFLWPTIFLSPAWNMKNRLKRGNDTVLFFNVKNHLVEQQSIDQLSRYWITQIFEMQIVAETTLPNKHKSQ